MSIDLVDQYKELHIKADYGGGTSILKILKSTIKTLTRKKKKKKSFSPPLEIQLQPMNRTTAANYYIAVAAIIKNEAHYLDEWLNFHRLVGVEHFYIYDNESTDGTSELLSTYQRAGLVTRIPWPNLPGWDGQVAAYAHATAAYREQCRWMMYIDADEFVFPSRSQTLAEVLPTFESYPVIYMPWRCFGHSGHKTRPEGLVIENYLRRAAVPTDTPPHIALRLRKPKSIVDPCRLGTVHVHKPVAEDRRSITVEDEILINHYLTRSEEEFEAKLKLDRLYLNNPDDMARRVPLGLATRDAIERETIEDVSIQRFAPGVRTLMESCPPGSSYHSLSG